MSNDEARDTAQEERARREHEAEARKRDPDERRDGDADDANAGGPPANVQSGTNTGS
jgi:hypothetical protein